MENPSCLEAPEPGFGMLDSGWQKLAAAAATQAVSLGSEPPVPGGV